MKILQINSVCSGSTGRIAAGISRMLNNAGHESLLLYGRGEPAADIRSERFESGFEVYAHVALSRLTDRQGFFSSLATRRLIHRIKEFQPDVIQLHNLHGYYLNWRLFLRYLSTIETPIVWTLHDCNAFTGHCAFFDAVNCDKWKTGCCACPQKHAYPTSWLVDSSARNYAEKRDLLRLLKNLTIVTPSEWLTGLAKQSFLGKHEIITIHNGVNLGVFRPRENDIRKKFCADEKSLIIGVANYWEPRKGLHAFYELAETLQKEICVALIGLSEKQIKSLPEHIIGLRRTRDANELAEWYTAADVFVNPTIEDNFPTTQIEALACGTPVVCYDTGGCSESLDERSGIVVPKGDVPALVAAVTHAITLRREDCLLRAATFDQQLCYRHYVDLYLRLNAEMDL